MISGSSPSVLSTEQFLGDSQTFYALTSPRGPRISGCPPASPHNPHTVPTCVKSPAQGGPGPVIPPEVAEVPVTLVLHETNRLLVWEGGHEGAV